MKKFVFVSFLGAFLLVQAVGAQEEVPKVLARDLVSLYRENEIRFNRNYLRKKVQVTGELVSVSVSKGAPTLILKDGSLMGMFIYCRASELDPAADLDKGDNVVVVGQCDVALGKITLSDCVIKVK
jgi:hypothetical protein